MGLFDGILGKKSAGDDVALEPVKGGYVLSGGKRAAGARISRVCVFFSVPQPLAGEPELLKGIMIENDVMGSLEPDAVISAMYETIPDIDEYAATMEMPESMNAFLMARAMLSGLARGPAEMAKLAVSLFNYNGVKGVIIQKET